MFPMKTSVVHDDDASGLETRQQHRLEPKLKQYAVHRSAVLERRNRIPEAKTGDDTGPRILFPAYRPFNYRAQWRAGVRAVQILIYAHFINVHKLFLGDGGNDLPELFSLLFIAFAVTYRFFYA